MITITEKIKEQFEEILSKKKIIPVYQPIISLEDGEVLGYEGLSRIDLEHCLFNTEEMFQIAEQQNKVWELEELCRKKTLMNAKEKPKGKKLFINVDPKVIHDENFKEGVTCKYLKQYGLKPKDIVFEITERTAIEDAETFKQTVNHYRRQSYQIAIDDFGNGYAGLSRICSLSPNFVKIDMSIVRDIDKDPIKKTLVESFVSFCENANIMLIAEGIETKEELKTLIKSGVSYGQGYYLQRPFPKLSDISDNMKENIRGIKIKSSKYFYKPSFFGNVGTICKARDITTPDTPGYAVFEYIEHNPLVIEICVVDIEKNVLGMLTRNELQAKFGGRFGFNLHAKKSVRELMDTDFLVVDAKTSIENVSKLALSRPANRMYDAVVVTQNNSYLGVVTVKNLLETAVSIQVSRAEDANPLTRLPGNAVIEEEVKKCIKSKKPFAIMYLDLDNFKAYNDAYGFNNGDIMIKTMAFCMEECCRNSEFKGHIGGDDFVITANYWEVDDLCQSIIHKFHGSIKDLYSKQDWKNEYILSKNRNGFEEKFPIATLSIAIITNKNKQFDTLDELSKELAYVKKKCKQVKGNSCICI